MAMATMATRHWGVFYSILLFYSQTMLQMFLKGLNTANLHVYTTDNCGDKIIWGNFFF